MNKSIYILFSLLLFISCKKQKKTNNEEINTNKNSKIEYAKGFDISYQEGYKVITLKNAWPGTKKVFKYALIEEATILDFPEQYDAIVTIPIKNIVVTSTTHIPSLEMLAVDQTLIGFPNLGYISSKKKQGNNKKSINKRVGKK